MRCALHPGWVRSKIDGDWHYIDARRLAFLYELKSDEYVVVDPEQPLAAYKAAKMLVEELGLISLHPRSDGNYTLPEENS